MDQTMNNHSELPHLPEIYELEITDPEITGIRLFKLTDKNTGVIAHFVEFNQGFDIHAAIAFAGARTSRTGKPFEVIFAEIYKASKEGRYSAGDKLAGIFNGMFQGYGHASVADMAPVMIRIEGIPMLEALVLFNSESQGGGQELSTRYVNFNDFDIAPLTKFVDVSEMTEEDYLTLESMWQGIQDYASKNYQRWNEIIAQRYKSFLTIDGDEPTASTLSARTFDISRLSLPVGSSTVVTMQASVRVIIDLIQQFREDGSYHSKALAEQLFTLLNLKEYQEGESIQANLGGLTKYSEGRFTIGNNLENLKEYLDTLSNPSIRDLLPVNQEPTGHHTEVKRIDYDLKSPGVLISMQYILAIYPELDELEVIAYLESLPDEAKSKIGSIIFQGHDHHNLMRNMGDVRGTLFAIETAIAYVRDFNRHRAMGRFIPLLENKDFATALSSGFNLNYQMHNTEIFKDLSEAWAESFEEYYRRLKEIYEYAVALGIEDTSFLVNLLPLAHQTKFHMSGPLTQLLYLTSLRSAEGGDFAYRDIADKIRDGLSDDPFLSTIMDGFGKTNPNNPKELLNRR